MRVIIGVLGMVVALAVFPGCQGHVDVAKSVKVESISTGWGDEGMVGGKNKVVPLAALKLKNVSNQPLRSLQVNAVFHRKGEGGEWGSAFVSAAGSGGLTPGGQTQVIVRSQLGYTGTDSTEALLANSHFVDATVDVFAKYGSGQWARVGEFPIERQLVRQ